MSTPTPMPAPECSNITYRGVVYPSLCDANGHMATRCYAAMFDDAGHHAFLQAETRASAKADPKLGWADVRQEIDYTREVRAGALVLISSRPVSLGAKSVRFLHRLHDARELAIVYATLSSVTVRFDLGARCAVAIDGALRAALEAWIAEAGDNQV